jgi:hypothetical protein
MSKQNKTLKHVGDLGIDDFRHHPVWTWWYDNPDESLVEPVFIDATKTLNPGAYKALFIFCKIQLNDGTLIDGSIALDGNIVYNLDFYKNNEVFLFAGEMFGDPEGTLEKLSKWLQKSIDDITPIEYVTEFVKGDNTPIKGKIDLREW